MTNDKAPYPSYPDISIIIIVGQSRKRGSNALASVLNQEEIERAEIILLDVALDHHPPLPNSTHPAVRTIQMSLDYTMGELRAYGAHIARAPVVAYLEEHALACPGWIKNILRGFDEGDWVAVGGVVVPAHDEPCIGKMVNMISFSHWTPGAKSGIMTMLPGHDTAYRRDALLALEPELADLLMIEPHAQSRLRDKGHTLYFSDQVRWIHLNEAHYKSLFIDHFAWNIMFGRTRVKGRHPLIRLFRLGTAPLILPIRTAKSMLIIYRSVGSRFPQYLRLFPYIIVLHLSEMVGLTLGYLGLGDDIGYTLSGFELSSEREPTPAAYEQ